MSLLYSNNLHPQTNILNTGCNENNHDRETLIIQSANGGFHEYYRLTDEQKEGLKDWKSGNGTVYKNFKYIDVKYNNQILFGPSVFEDDDNNE
jgi:hypothetical protein